MFRMEIYSALRKIILASYLLTDFKRSQDIYKV